MTKEGRKERKVSTSHSLAHTAALLGAVLLAGLPGSARADGELEARFDYSMPARFAVPTPVPDGSWEVYTDGVTHPATWRVDFDACASTGTIAEYRWTIGGSSAGSSSSCDGFSHDFLAEGEYAVSLTVADGEDAEDTDDGSVVVQDWLIFGLGDSYGSGEGNPEVSISLADINLAETAEAAWEAATTSEAAQAYLAVLEALDATVADVVAVQDELEEFISALAEWEEECTPFPGLGCVSATVALAAATEALLAELALLGLDLDYDDLVAIASSFAELDNDTRDAIASTWEALEAALEALTPTWQNRRCHRSATSGQVRAAQILEETDPRSSVTFVHLACSGATISSGLLGEYAGIEADGPLIPSQIAQATQVAGEREIDMLVVSIGGNDANFGSVLETCMVGEPCHDSPSLDPTVDDVLAAVCDAAGPLVPDCDDYIAGIGVQDANDLFEDGLDDLPAAYQALADAIEGQLDVDPGRVYLTEYPDVTRDETGAYCGWSAEQDLSEQIVNLPGVSQSELEWVDTHAATRLRATMQSAATTHRWSFVEGIAAPFGTHGYCAEDNWLVRVQESYLRQGDECGSVHPGPDGHEAVANAIAVAFPVPEPGLGLSLRAALLALALWGHRHRRRTGSRDRVR